MKKMIRKHEDRLAGSLAELKLESTSPSPASVVAGSLGGDMEWFLTWRLNLGHYPSLMWCDGADELLVTRIGRHAYHVKGKAWIGPVADVTVQSIWELEGTITLNSRLDKLRSYEISIWDEEVVLRTTKGTAWCRSHFNR